jgi:hypothetical protein
MRGNGALRGHVVFGYPRGPVADLAGWQLARKDSTMAKREWLHDASHRGLHLSRTSAAAGVNIQRSWLAPWQRLASPNCALTRPRRLRFKSEPGFLSRTFTLL